MPRKSKIKHPLRELRQTIGLSQKDFARLIGVTASTVKRIENATLKLSQELSGRIFLATGLLVVEISTGPLLFRWPGDVDAKETSDEWRKEFRSDSTLASALATQLARWIEIILVASARPSVGKTIQVFHSLMQALHRISQEFQLQNHIEAHLTDRHSTETDLYRVAELRQNLFLASLVKFRDDSTLKDDNQIALTRPTGYLRHGDLFNLIWTNRELLQELLTSSDPDSFRNLPDDLAIKLTEIERKLESFS